MKSYIRMLLKGISRITPLRNFLRRLSQKGLMPQALQKRLPVEGTFTVFISSNEFFRYHSTSGDQTGRALFWGGKGGIEPETLDYFDKHIRNARIMADIGANVGHFTLYGCAVNPTLRVHSFEPVERSFNHLGHNIDINNWRERVDLVKAAVGDYDGETQIHIPFDDFPSSASLEQEGFNKIKGTLVTTPIIRLDTYFQSMPSPDLIKIDVEGFEHLVLKGAEGLFARGLRPHIILECNPDGPGTHITNILHPLGYRFFNLHASGPISCNAIGADSSAHYRNWAALSRNAA